MWSKVFGISSVFLCRNFLVPIFLLIIFHNLATTIMAQISDICGVSLCSKMVDSGIQCNRCGRWYHEKCAQMSKQCYLLHQKHKELKWVCNHCVALAEECSRILARAMTVARPTEKETKGEPEIKPPSERVTLKTDKFIEVAKVKSKGNNQMKKNDKEGSGTDPRTK